MAEFHPLRSLDDKLDDPAWTQMNEKAEGLAKSKATATMPSLDHLTFRDYEKVYEPAADTFLLIDALRYELFESRIFSSRSEAVFVMEIGCGTGTPSVFLRNHWHADDLKLPPLVSFATDINPTAIRVAKETAKQSLGGKNPPTFETIQCDIASALLPRLQHAVSIVLFNPPYVPTPDDEVGSGGIEAAWAGGVHGRRVIDRSFEQIANLLEKPDGCAYIVTVDDNKPREMAEICRSLSLTMRPLFRRKAHNEFLTVQKVTWC